MMTPLTVNQLNKIADAHSITYERLKATPSRAIATRMARVFNLPQERMFEIFADVGNHTRFFPHLKKVITVSNADLGNVLEDNQVLIVEGLEEGGSKVGVKLFTLHPPDRIECNLLTDPFPENIVLSDRKRGAITWKFEKIDDNSSRMTVESTFNPDSNKFFKRGMVDHVWIDFFENAMVELGELNPTDRFTNLLGERPQRFVNTFG